MLLTVDFLLIKHQ